MASNPTIKISAQDFERLTELVERFMSGKESDAADRLDGELSRAEVLPADRVPADVVTMNSRVVFEEEESGMRREVVLVYPGQANALQGRVSVMAPVGSAILGLPVGGVIDWPMPGGRSAKLRIVSVEQRPSDDAPSARVEESQPA